MLKENTYNPLEIKKEIIIEPPLVESFLDLEQASRIWPKEIVENESFLEQIKSRKEMINCVDDVISQLPKPDTSIESAIEQGCIKEEQATKLYESLSNFFESEQDYRRLLLYLPFEFLPNEKWLPKTTELKEAIDKFKNAFLNSWKNQLDTYDVRANFVDGDIIDDGYRNSDHPRVVKAAHLIPKMVENGLLNTQEVFDLISKSDDEILRNSIADTLPVLADRGTIAENEIEFMAKSPDQLLSNMSRIISANMQDKKSEKKEEQTAITFAFIQKEIDEEISKIESDNYGNISSKRKDWLIENKKQNKIELLGKSINEAIINNNFSNNEINFFLRKDADDTSQQALIEGIRMAIESEADKNIVTAQAFYKQYEKVLLTLWQSNSPKLDDALIKTFSRLHHAQIVNDEELSELGIVLPKLAGPFSENFKINNDKFSEIKSMAASIESNPELSKYIFPVTLVYGSSLKGYGKMGSDIDLAVFVKPETSPNEKEKLRTLLNIAFPQEKIKGEIIEFWLEENNNKYNIRDFTESEPTVGESYWTHILFGAVWEGDKNAINEIREKLLANYLYANDKKIRGKNQHDQYLEELERDTLQYRLLHKGYERFYPPCGGIHTTHADEIDNNSMFYDSGYRQLATKLFLNRVFLPQIPKN